MPTAPWSYERRRPTLPRMSTLPEVRDRLRKDLHDTDPGDERWSDDQLDRHIEHALEEVSLAIPLELTADVATTPGSRDIAVDEIDGLIEIEAVEFPVGDFPPLYIGFSRWADTVALHLETSPQGDDVRLYYTAWHNLDDDGGTLPQFLEDLVVTGAAAYAALELSAFAIDRLNSGGSTVPEQLASWGRARLTAFQQLLQAHGRKNRVRARRLYAPA